MRENEVTKPPPGLSLILVGSGLYWILSSQLIRSFTVLSANNPASTTLGTLLVEATGVGCLALGLSLIQADMERLLSLYQRRDGWVYTIPIMLAAIDVYVTLVGTQYSQVVELNPLVASSTQNGPIALVPFLLSYIALSTGLALALLKFGSKLFPSTSSLRALGFACACGAAGFGPASNITLLVTTFQPFATLAGMTFSVGLITGIVLHFRPASLVRS